MHTLLIINSRIKIRIADKRHALQENEEIFSKVHFFQKLFDILRFA